jgi:hypothetical protein
MVQLELDQRFAPDTDLDAVWRAGIAALVAAPSARPNELRNDEHNFACQSSPRTVETLRLT